MTILQKCVLQMYDRLYMYHGLTIMAYSMCISLAYNKLDNSVDSDENMRGSKNFRDGVIGPNWQKKAFNCQRVKFSFSFFLVSFCF